MKWLLNLMVASLIFFPDKSYYALPRDYGLAAEDIFLTTQDGVRLHGWYFEAAQPKACLLFFHGNAGNISMRIFKAKGWLERGVSVFLLDYRSYGKSEGKIHKGSDLVEDARAALRWLEEDKKVSSEKILLYGESIGAYPAIQLAREKRFAGLILEAAFTSLLELARANYGGWVPEFLLSAFEMNNGEAIREAKAPLFFLHGDQDSISPVAQGKRLYEIAPTPKELFIVPGGDHNDLPETAGEAFFETPYRFFLREKALS
jgi:fermentation-respiration switch protein FrsA (DUF1100 family)